MTNAQDASPQRTALVLSGGGSLGAIQVGMLAELAAAGVRPDFVVGVSAGAINGAFFAHAPDGTMVEKLTELWCQVTTREALGLSWRSLLGLLGLSDHLANPSGVRALLERNLPYRRFEETAVPLHIVCADLVTGAEVVLSRGDVIEAVLASAAIPGVFPPVKVEGRTLVDGVVAAGTPIATAGRLGASRLIVLPCGFACADKTVSGRALGRAMHAIALIGARQLKQDYERYAGSLAIHVVPPLCPLEQSSYDYSKGATLIARARESTRRWLEEGGLSRREFPGELIEHTH
ncbi:MAG TPA: patatin-like phospholipase family protein [Steroidobacteraceae bacterium]|nr:patatin-like phospholipase family protein [Steroidobacteraceae bacterium]